MKKTLLILFLLSTTLAGKGQNLVPNGGFEGFSSCPTGISQIDTALFWTNPCLPPYGTSGTGSGSSDYFNACAPSGNIDVPLNFLGYQFAHTGNGYAGMFPYYSFYAFREYIEVSLINPLIANNCYYFEMYVNCANGTQVSVDTLGVYFSDTLITGFHTHDTLPFTPQLQLSSGFISDTLNWLLLSGTYTASGGESYLIIGNFNSDARTNTSGGSGSAYIYIDDVSLSPCTGIEEQNQNEAITIYPNPVKDELQVSGLKFKAGEKAEIKIYDIIGKEAYRTTSLTSDFRLPTSTFQTGIYFIEINTGNEIFRKKFLKE